MAGDDNLIAIDTSDTEAVYRGAEAAPLFRHLLQLGLRLVLPIRLGEPGAVLVGLHLIGHTAPTLGSGPGWSRHL